MHSIIIEQSASESMSQPQLVKTLGVLHQVEREDRRSQKMESFFNSDSMLLFLGLAGLVYSFLRKKWIVVL